MNKERYSDPTAEIAIANVMREAREKEKLRRDVIRKKESEKNLKKFRLVDKS